MFLCLTLFLLVCDQKVSKPTKVWFVIYDRNRNYFFHQFLIIFISSLSCTPPNKIIGCEKERMEKIPLRTRKRQAGKALSFSSRKKDEASQVKSIKTKPICTAKIIIVATYKTHLRSFFSFKDDLSCNLFF